MPSPPPTALRGADLRDVDVAAVRWRGADLRGANLSGLDLSGQDLSGADLRGAVLDGTTARDSRLNDVDLHGATARDADWTGADLSRSEAHDLVAPGIRLVDTRLHGADWRRADLRGADLDGARGSGFRLDRARASGLSALGASLPRAVLDEADLDGAVLREAQLTRAAFYSVRGTIDLRGCDLRGADLRFADLRSATLSDADLAGARVGTVDPTLEARLLELGWRLPVARRAWRFGRERASAWWISIRERRALPVWRPKPPRPTPTSIVIEEREEEQEDASLTLPSTPGGPRDRRAPLPGLQDGAPVVGSEPPGSDPAAPSTATLSAARATAKVTLTAVRRIFSANEPGIAGAAPSPPARRGREDVLVEDRLGFPEDVARREDEVQEESLTRYLVAREAVRKRGIPAMRAAQSARWAQLQAERERAAPPAELPWAKRRREATLLAKRAIKAVASPRPAETVRVRSEEGSPPSRPGAETQPPAPVTAARRPRSHRDAEAHHDFSRSAAARERRIADSAAESWLGSRRRVIIHTRLAAGLPAEPPLDFRAVKLSALGELGGALWKGTIEAWVRGGEPRSRLRRGEASGDVSAVEARLDFRVTAGRRAQGEGESRQDRAFEARLQARKQGERRRVIEREASAARARDEDAAAERMWAARQAAATARQAKVRTLSALSQSTHQRRDGDAEQATQARLRVRLDRWEQENAGRAELEEAELRIRRAERLSRLRAGIAAVPARLVSEAPRVWAKTRRAFVPRARPETVGPGLDLTEARLDDAELAGADLHGTLLIRASLVGADLRGADLRGADLSDADLTDCRLSGAQLEGANLERAILDQALLDGVSFEGCRVSGARMVAVRGLGPRTRSALDRAGADLGSDASWTRRSAWLTAGSIAAGALLYAGLIWDRGESTDAAALEHAAAEAQRLGKTAEAADAFEDLANQQDEPEIKVNYLLEAASAAGESGDHDRALALLDEALQIGLDTPIETTVRLRLARAQHRASLSTAAATGYRELLARIDLTPTQQAEAIVGLYLALGESDTSEAVAIQERLMASASTDLSRSGLALALADGWAGAGRMELARGVVESALGHIATSADTAALRLRLARLLFDSGDADGALAVYRELMALSGSTGQEARLGGADLLIRRGDDLGAAALLGELAMAPDETLRSRALIPLAGIAARQGDDARAVEILRNVLDIADLEPRQMDEARVMLGRLLVRSDPGAAAALVSASPALRHELLLGQAEALREAGRRADARALWLEVAEDERADEEARASAHMSLAELQVEERDYDGALDRYEQMMELTSSITLRQRIQLGYSNTLVRLGRLQDAEARYMALMAASEGDVAFQCKLGLARTAELRGQAEKAARLYAEVGQTEGPWAVEALLSLGQMREKAGDLTAAAEALRLARSARGADAERKVAVDIALARVLLAANDPNAELIYASLLSADDPAVRVAARLAVAPGLLTTDPARARTYYEEALAEMGADGERAEARAGWLRASISLGEPEVALERVQAWLAAETSQAQQGELAVVAVRALRAEGRYTEAEALATRHLEVGGFELGMEHAGLLRDMGRFDEALARLKDLDAESADDEAWLLETVGDTALNAGELAAAEAAYAGLAGMPGGQLPSALGRARLLREAGKLTEALELLEDLEDERVLAERAVVLDGLGRYDEAETLYRRMALSTSLEARSAAAVGLGRVLLERDDAMGALATLEAIGTLDEGYRLTGAQVKAEAYLALGNRDEARAIYQSLTGDAEARFISGLGLAELTLLEGKGPAAAAQFRALFSTTEDRYYQAQALAGEIRALAEAGDASAARERFRTLTAEYPERTDAISSARASVP